MNSNSQRSTMNSNNQRLTVNSKFQIFFLKNQNFEKSNKMRQNFGTTKFSKKKIDVKKK